MKFCILSSGSKGNATYVESKEAKLLFDCGINYKQLCIKLEEIGQVASEIEAVVISHEHGDHIKGVERLVKEHDIPIFANSSTIKEILKEFSFRPKFRVFTTGEAFHYKDMVIQPFSIQHDTVDPVAFTITVGEEKLGLCTDLGFATSSIEHELKGCRYLVLEANHEVDLVHASSRPNVYKERVLSKMGHLSNDQCAELLSRVYHPGLEKVFLAHLSQECNRPEIALEKVSKYLEKKLIKVELLIAHQDQVTWL
jgi:phosphoribosyl 1,2-cyclic phosphodiesterase